MKIYEGRLGIVEEIRRRQRVTYVRGDDKYQKTEERYSYSKGQVLKQLLFPRDASERNEQLGWAGLWGLEVCLEQVGRASWEEEP